MSEGRGKCGMMGFPFADGTTVDDARMKGGMMHVVSKNSGLARMGLLGESI